MSFVSGAAIMEGNAPPLLLAFFFLVFVGVKRKIAKPSERLYRCEFKFCVRLCRLLRAGIVTVEVSTFQNPLEPQITILSR